MATTAVSPAAQVGIQDFLKILVTQLNNQDPLKPLDNQEFVTQLAQFTSLQQTQELNDKISTLLSIQGSMQSIGLLGKTVTVDQATGTVTGQVSALDFVNGEPRLTLTLASGGAMSDIALSDLVSVR